MDFSLDLPGVRCAPLGWEDAERLQRLLAACSEYFAKAEGHRVSKRDGQERIAEALGDEDQLLLGMRTEGSEALVGLLDLRTHTPEPEAATIALLLIDPGHRRHGLAAALVTDFIRAAKEAGFRSIHLGVRDGAAGARAFWEAQGFAETGREAGLTNYVHRLRE